jgi:hypothetical protein
MRRLRVFLFLLLSLGVPLQGYAHVALPELYCPMERMALAGMEVDAVHDCCVDAEKATETGKTCKSGQSCQSAGQFFPVSWLEVLPRNPASSARFPHLADVNISFDPAAAWRPPAQL